MRCLRVCVLLISCPSMFTGLLGSGVLAPFLTCLSLGHADTRVTITFFLEKMFSFTAMPCSDVLRHLCGDGDVG